MFHIVNHLRTWLLSLADLFFGRHGHPRRRHRYKQPSRYKSTREHAFILDIAWRDYLRGTL